jgi:hypothetical protein
MKPRKKSFKQLYKEAARMAAKIPGFPSKDKILIEDPQKAYPIGEGCPRGFGNEAQEKMRTSKHR